MAENVEIAEFGPSDGLTPLQVKKLNWNFRRLAANGGGSIGQSRYSPQISGSYAELDDLPSIEHVELVGNKNFDELNLNRINELRITQIWNSIVEE